MTSKEARSVALGAIRSELRRQGKNPATFAGCPLSVLDEISRQDATLVASKFYNTASSAQHAQLLRDWKKWQAAR